MVFEDLREMSTWVQWLKVDELNVAQILEDVLHTWKKW